MGITTLTQDSVTPCHWLKGSVVGLPQRFLYFPIGISNGHFLQKSDAADHESILRSHQRNHTI